MADLKGDAKARYVARMFGRISRRYDLLNTVMTVGQHHRWRRVAARVATRRLAGPALDVATGTGDLAFALAARPEVGLVVGVDLVPQMLALARAKARRRRVASHVRLLQGDAMALPFSDNTFACATAGFSLRNVADVPQALREMVRVVRPGGRVVVLEISPLRGKGIFSWLFRLYFHRLVPLLGGLLAGDREAYAYLPQSVEAFLGPARLTHLMEEVGLRRARFLRLAWGTVAVHLGEKP
ncbi:MAG: ubiquinone/menaquinone biosynthesis methyltransferase [Chloroflexi bacterium]|nr:ubiquinone/menaquinone biosynthesis methyltransferase [Chloroflexota bacterium]